MASLAQALEALKSGKIISYPTETIWGLGVDAYNNVAVENLFNLKGRDSTKAMSILVRDSKYAEHLAEVDVPTRRLMRVFWPGAVTFVLPTKDSRLAAASGNSGFVGLRCSSHPLVRQLVWKYKNPVTTTSANLAGEPVAADGATVKAIFKDVEVIDELGVTQSGTASLVVKIDQGSYQILRSQAEIEDEFCLYAGNFGLKPGPK